MQPYLADLLRCSLFPVPGIIVKIGAIEKWSKFGIDIDGGDYLGIEPGGDAPADLNMDDFMVFDNDEGRAVTFFRHMIFRHSHSIADQNKEGGLPITDYDLTRIAFTQESAFVN